MNNTDLKIAILINGFSSPITPAVRAAFVSAITNASSLINNHIFLPTIEFYDPIVAQVYPDPEKYDLIVLSGGTADPMGSDPWVLKLQSFLRRTVQSYPRQKIVGVCWGHQTICVTFGGCVGGMTKAEVGVTQVGLNSTGAEMFPFAMDQKLFIHEFHRREIVVPAEGFVALAEKNQSFVNATNTIMTFQGHPELNEDLSKKMLSNAPSYMLIEEDEKERLNQSLENHHDGIKIWRRILEWAQEL